MRALVLIAVLISVSFAGYAADDGMPFGQITEADVERLDQFARSTGFALTQEMQRAYDKDTKALARVFQFSTTFTRLDRNARTYGQIIYSSLLRLGETMGVEAYAKVLGAQTPAVQQRVRDFLYFPVTQVPQRHRKEVEKETRTDYPTLFPPTYHFGHDDPLFPTKAYALQRTAPHVTAAASGLRLSAPVQPPRRAPRSLSLGSLGR